MVTIGRGISVQKAGRGRGRTEAGEGPGRMKRANRVMDG